MNKIKIGAQVTAKVCPTNVTVSGTFQGYELQDKEDPTSVCGKVFYVKDGIQRLDFVYIDSIKVDSDGEDERIRKIMIEHFKNQPEQYSFGGLTNFEIVAWLEKRGWLPENIELNEGDSESIRKILYGIVYQWGNEQQAWCSDKKVIEKMLAYIEKQKEQKPVKLNDDTEVGLDRALQIVKAAKGNLYGYQSDDGIYECCHAIQTLERILKNGIEQKPKNILTDDDSLQTAYLKGQTDVLEDPEAYGLQKEQKPTDISSLRDWKLIVDAVLTEHEGIGQYLDNPETERIAKKLQERFSLPQSKPAEWSEEDDWKRKELIQYLKEKGDYRTVWMTWLKSLRPKPHWKPSEKQMKTLNAVANEGVLLDLFNDLLKLF